MKENPQIEFGETEIVDEELLGALEDWRGKNASRRALSEQEKAAKAKAVGLFEKHKHGPGSYRCGPYVIKVEVREERDLSFTVEEREQTTIVAPKVE